MHVPLPCLLECAGSLPTFRVPSIPATAATYRQHYRRYRQHYRRYRQHYRCYRRRRRSDRCCRPPGHHWHCRRRRTTAALAPLAAAANRHGCSATSDLTHRRCLCYRRRSTVAIAVCWNVVSFCRVCDVTGLDDSQ